jgi:hypothetical protein
VSARVRRLELDDKEDGTCELCDPFEDQDGREKANEPEARIEALEKTPYFEVVDENDRVIFRVGPEGARLFDARSNPVADLGASPAGGWLTLRSGDAEVSLAATGSSAMRIREGGVTRMDVGTVQGAPYALRVSSPTSIIAGIGQSRAGGGAVSAGRGGDLPEGARTGGPQEGAGVEGREADRQQGRRAVRGPQGGWQTGPDRRRNGRRPLRSQRQGCGDPRG